MLQRVVTLFPLLLMLHVSAGGQTDGDLCRVTVTDVRKDERVVRAIAGDAAAAEVVRLMTLSTKEVGSFVTDVGFRRVTRRDFSFPAPGLLITVEVSYSHAMRRASGSLAPTVRVGLGVREKRRGGRHVASAATETIYSQLTEFVSTQAWLTVRGRLYDVMVSCERRERK